MPGTVLITGGTGGLGTAVTERFLDEGWRVVVPVHGGREPSGTQPRPGLHLIQADLMDAGSVAECVSLATADAGAALAAVVNLVGGFAQHGRVHETAVEDFEAQLRLNLRPAYLVCQATIPHLLAGGGGAIVCVSSRAALRPFSGAAGYVTAKAAVLALVDALAAEYTGDHIRVNAILPSVIDTPANRAAQPNADHSRWVPPSQIAAVVHFLCSPESAAVGGAHLPVYGRA
jgi:NAD(P)-dependent dehydrogenase (short-subunit alcohol dehydrogenase family)